MYACADVGVCVCTTTRASTCGMGNVSACLSSNHTSGKKYKVANREF